MKLNLEALESLPEEDLVELAEEVLHETIKVLRNLSMRLLPQAQLSTERQHFYVKLLINLTDSIHNLPTYLKKKDVKGLRFEMEMAAGHQLNYFHVRPSLISELYAYGLVNTFMEKGIMIKG